MGFDKCNTLVVGLLREALVAQGRAALWRLPYSERTGSVLFGHMCWLLEDMGKLEEARLLYEERLQERRERLGDRDPTTLNSMNDLASLLKRMGQLEEARPLYEEVRRGRSQLLFSMCQLLEDMGKPEEARPLLEEELQVCRETLGDRDPSTRHSIFLLARLLEKQGKLVEAIPLFTEELEGHVLLYGMEDKMTRRKAKLLVSYLREVGQEEKAEALADKHGLADN